MKVFLSLVACLPLSLYARDEWELDNNKSYDEGEVEWRVEMQGSASKGKTPLWLNANKYGLSSLEKNNGYLRASLLKPYITDMEKKVSLGYGVDVALPVNYTSKMVVQQAFVEARWLHGVLSIGSKEYPMELKNQSLSSGSQTLGINARPVPQARLSLPKYWTIPIWNGWLQLKGHIAYGMMTDDNWQHEFTARKSKYADHVLYHSKAGYLRIGNENYFCPWSVELGLEMAAQFGGKPFMKVQGKMTEIPTESGLKGLWHAFIPGGADSSDGTYANAAGNQLGSWLMRVNYEADSWQAHLYADHFFEDHSQMFMLDYNGYGEGSEWNTPKDRRYFRYALKDMMLGAEVNLRNGKWLRNMVFEYLYTKYQSGPYNHDRTMNIPDHVAGLDDYYNHGVYPGWQHWGQVMGNPLYRSPIYNSEGKINVDNNRFIAYHLGLEGFPMDHLSYRTLISFQKGWGTYNNPFTKKQENVSFLVEGRYLFDKGWQIKAAYAMDFGKEQMLGNNAGFQLTISKSGFFKIKSR